MHLSQWFQCSRSLSVDSAHKVSGGVKDGLRPVNVRAIKNTVQASELNGKGSAMESGCLGLET